MPEDVPEITDPTEPFLQQNLPFCIQSVDVSNYNYVNPMTLEQASALYFNLSSIDISSSILAYSATTPTNSESFSFTDVEYPDGEEGWGVEPFKLSTQHIETKADPSNSAVTTTLTYSEREVEPIERAACGPASSTRGVYSYLFLGSVYASIELNRQFVKMYDGDTNDESNHIGYGYPIGVIQMHSGLSGLDANGVAYGNYAEDGDWEPEPDDLFAYPNWWGEFGPFYGDWLISDAQPNNVTNVNIDGFPFVAAYWTGRDSIFSDENISVTWTASGLPSSGAFNFYNYVE